jgi:hypothetical protein
VVDDPAGVAERAVGDCRTVEDGAAWPADGVQAASAASAVSAAYAVAVSRQLVMRTSLPTPIFRHAR